ncbi:S53 family peptidase [Dictyobacter arantiisoli]|uniref:S53 family peptidase n=1 Tax=Dictyobacter arantiisoli TaxID=2014874 RepID=UPI0011EDBDDF|nr:S53 family peptidase [Dictyobacter arantiisoli]
MSTSIQGHASANMFTQVIHKHHALRWLSKDPPDDAGCRVQMQMPCYSPDEIHNAYGLTPLLHNGFNGTGQTIVLIDSFGSPHPLADLKRFDKDYGLPDPPSFKVLNPLGTVPFDTSNSDQMGWAQETNLDIQWAHAIAPGAGIVLLTSPVSETQGVQGLPEFLKLEQYAVNHHLGKIISQSWGATEETLFMPTGKQVMNNFNTFYQATTSEQHVTFIASSGDSGSVNPDVNGNNYPFATVGFPADSPWVTAVGGTSLHADTSGNYQSETVWNGGVGNASGGGYSQYFKAPDFQKSLPASAIAGSHGYRGVPDVSYNGDPTTSIPVYLSFMSEPGYYLFGGTSSGAPQWAGLVAITNQLAGHPLGFINNELYNIGSNPSLYGLAFHDIIQGNNTQGNISGFSASVGWDPVTGWGTPKATYLLPLLAHLPALTVIPFSKHW